MSPPIPGVAGRLGAAAQDIRVMIVDDSAVVRGFVTRWLEEEGDISIVSSVGNGMLALKAVERSAPDVVVLDIEMPDLDGMETLPRLLAMVPTLQVIMSSTLSRRNAAISLEALSKGAADYIAKPSLTRDPDASLAFKRELVGKVKALGLARRGRDRREATRARVAADTAAPAHRLYGDRPVILRPASSVRPRVLAIGSSTGGPQALLDLFTGLRNSVELPVFITQHMPETFTSILADHIARSSSAPCAEAVDEEPVKAGHVYVARGGLHMVVTQQNGQPVIRLTQDPPENFCRPAVDVMFRSLAKVYGAATLAVVLTGMGSDGLKGGRAIVQAGGSVLAQDEATSVVWGMPGAVATDGQCSAILPLAEVGPAITKVLAGGRI